MRTKQRRKMARRRPVPSGVATRPNKCWSMDFVSDKLADGRSFRILTLVDQFTRECVGLEADRSMTGMKKALRNSIANSRLKPSGTNFTSTPATTAPRIFWHTSVKH